MAIGFRPGADMQKAYNTNKSKLRKKKSLKDLNKDYHENSHEAMTFNQMDEDQYQEWRENLQKQFQRDKQIKLTVGVIVFILCLVLFIYIMI